MRSKRFVASLVALGAIAGPTVAAAAGTSQGASRHRSVIVLSKPLPSMLQIGQRVTLTGEVRRSPGQARIGLQSMRATTWKLVSSAPLGIGGLFTVRWQIPSTTTVGPVKLRLILERHGRSVATTAPSQSFIGPAPVYCHPATPPSSVPAGDGWIVGGLYGEGGAYPGAARC